MVVGFGQAGGAQHWLLTLLDATDRLDVRVVMLEHGPLSDRFAEQGIPVEVVATGAGATAIARSAVAIGRVLRRDRSEVVLANGVKAAAVAVPAAWVTGTPSVWAKHDFSHDRRLARPLGRLCDRVVAVSAAVAAPTGRHDTVLVPPPIPAPPLPTSEARATWVSRGVPIGRRPVLGMATRLVPYKGVDTAIRAIAHTDAWHLAVAGANDRSAPHERERLADLAEQLGVADRVHLVGTVPAAGRSFVALDAVAVLTRVDDEGFGREGYGIAALEAVRSGTPLIAATGNPEAERLAAHGGIVTDHSPTDVARALDHIAGQQVEMSEEAARLRDHPDAALCADRLASTLARVARRPGAGTDGHGPSVSVVVCARDEAASIDELLRSLVPQLRDDELLLVDDDSHDATGTLMSAWADRDPRIRTLRGAGAGVAAARNLGMSHVKHTVVAMTDAGCEPHHGWLDGLRQAFADRESPSIAAGVHTVGAERVWQHAAALACFPDAAAATRRTPLTRARRLLFGGTFDEGRVDTRSMGTTVDAWRSVGGFRTELRNASDAAYGRDVVAAGGLVVSVPGARVTWHHRSTMRAAARMYHRYAIGTATAGDRTALSRDAIRLGVYTFAPIAVSRPGIGRRVAAAGTAAYLGPGLVRACRTGAGMGVIAAIPVVVMLKDIARITGAARGVIRRGSLRW